MAKSKYLGKGQGKGVFYPTTEYHRDTVIGKAGRAGDQPHGIAGNSVPGVFKNTGRPRHRFGGAHVSFGRGSRASRHTDNE
jgi:hypothetical protein